MIAGVSTLPVARSVCAVTVADVTRLSALIVPPVITPWSPALMSCVFRVVETVTPWSLTVTAAMPAAVFKLTSPLAYPPETSPVPACSTRLPPA